MEINALFVAKILHNIIRNIKRIDGSIPVQWEELEFEQQCNAINAVKEIYSCAPKIPEELHELWMKPLVENGWEWGNQYSFESKTHPSITEFENLPESEVLKDVIWSAVTEAFREFVKDE